MLFKMSPAFPSVDFSNSFHCSHSALQVRHHETCDSVLYELGNGTQGVSNDGCAARHSLNQHQAKGLAPIDGKDKGSGVPEKNIFLGIPNFTDELDERVIE
jgi:hypothetical protein